MQSSSWIIVTSIHPPTEAMKRLAEFSQRGWRVLMVADRKTPNDWAWPNVDVLTVQQQCDLYPKLADLIPWNHYARKNLGYLYAIRNGAKVILETDDDNIPRGDFTDHASLATSARLLGGSKWINIYRRYTEHKVWPRGLPLDKIRESGSDLGAWTGECPIKQGLADVDPDVDAIYRLIDGASVEFDSKAGAHVVDAGCFVPFNSQNTVFHRESFPCLYLPCHVEFRLTDIWRSLVAQATLWSQGRRLAFFPATVYQERNPHNLLKDFEEEVRGYLHNDKISSLLQGQIERIPRGSGYREVVVHLWLAMMGDGYVPEHERPVLDAWMENV